MAAVNLPGNDGAPDLSLSAPSFDWEHMVDQLNQDPHADSMTDSSRGTVSIEGGRTDIVGDEEVETRNEGPTTCRDQPWGLRSGLGPPGSALQV